jgi:hypothetical protein
MSKSRSLVLPQSGCYPHQAHYIDTLNESKLNRGKAEMWFDVAENAGTKQTNGNGTKRETDNYRVSTARTLLFTSPTTHRWGEKTYCRLAMWALHALPNG